MLGFVRQWVPKQIAHVMFFSTGMGLQMISNLSWFRPMLGVGLYIITQITIITNHICTIHYSSVLFIATHHNPTTFHYSGKVNASTGGCGFKASWPTIKSVGRGSVGQGILR